MLTALEDLQTVLGDRYRLARELGRGGMATVYLAEDLQRQRQVAVKVLHPDLGMALGPERFRREIDIASRLSHPHILAIDDFGEVGGTMFFVMPYVTGETLATRMQREGMMPVEEAVKITCQVARALDHAHRQGIIHRDVKPENILFEDGEALLADFGIARAINDVETNQRLTKTGLTLGTPVYMSPEQAVAERVLDGRSDIYSLGCVLYEMLAGQPPFVGPTAQAIIARQMMGEVPSITVVRGTVPDEVEDAVLRALAKNAVDRFATAAEFAEALEHSLQTSGRSLGRADRRNRTRRPRLTPTARRRRLAAVYAGAVVLVLASAGAWYGLGRGVLTSRAAEVEGGLSPKDIAVLYFEDGSPDRQLGALADGLTEELIAALGSVQELRVVSRNGVAPFRDGTAPADSVAGALRVGTLVQGRIEPRGDALRVTVRLVDGASGADYKRAAFDVPAADALAARDKVVDQVARFLRARIGDEVKLREVRRATTNDEAWGLALQAEKLRKSAQALARANDTLGASRARLGVDSLLVRASRLDGRWAGPVVERGRLALERMRAARDPVAARRWADSTSAHADAALALDANDASALALRGTVRLERWRRHLEPDARAAAALLAGAEKDLKQATRLAPNDAAAWSSLARVYYEKPDLVEATLAARRAYETDAYLSNADGILWRLYTTAYDNESFLDASRWCDEGRARFPENPLFVRCQLWLLTTNARPPDGARGWQLLRELEPLVPARDWPFASRESQMLVAAALGKSGLKDSADRVLKRARAGPDVDPERELLSHEALVRELLGQRDEALALLKQFIVAKPEHRTGYANSQSWWWRGLKTDPRFQELVGITQ